MRVDAPARVAPIAERLLAAKRVLVTAETAAGMRATLSPLGRSRPTAPVRLTGEGTTAGRLADGSPTPDDVSVNDRILPVPEALVSFFPLGGLRRGSAIQVEGSTSLLLSLAATACREGAWCAVVGWPDVGLAAAAERGLPLDRVALVPKPGPDAAAVLGAVIDGFDVVVLGDMPQLIERDRRLLASRLRHREAVLLTAVRWPGAEVVLSVAESRWGGVGQGHGSLRGRELTVRVGGRGAAGGRGGQARLSMPDGVRLVPAGPSVRPGTGGDVARHGAELAPERRAG